jgi:PKD repeat protein
MKRDKVAHILTMTMVLAGLAIPGPVAAQDSGLTLVVSSASTCEQNSFEITVTGGNGPFDLHWAFGDGEVLDETGVSDFPHLVGHAYPGSGSYAWSVVGVDAVDASLTGTASGSLALGPTVNISSDVVPPILPLVEGEATVSFTAHVTGGTPPFVFGWDLEGDGSPDVDAGSGNTASHTYTEPGVFAATVTVTDACGLQDSDTLHLEVSDVDQTCHPMAEKIAEALGPYFPDRTQQPYTCEGIFAIFEGSLTGSQLGFGRLWQATRLLDLVDDLTWEDVLDWHLDGTGWGTLVQLDRLSEALDDIGTGDLVAMVLDGTATINDIRSAARAAIQFDADFTDALARLAEGASPGDLGQFYRLAGDLDISPEELDAYLASGQSLSGIRHAGSLADRFGGDLDLVAAAHGAGNTWGEIAQAFRLADESVSVEDLLALGAHAHREVQRDEAQAARGAEREAQLVARMAEMFGVSKEAILAALNGCAGDWNCARSQLREETRTGSTPEVTGERDTATAERLARQYNVSVDEVWAVYDGVCQGDWGCTRLHFRGEPGGRPNSPGKK